MANHNTTFPTLLARLGIGYLSLSPLMLALELALRALPAYPALEKVYSASVYVKAGWIALGPLGIAAFVLLRRRPLAGAVLAIVFALAHALLARILWQHVDTGFWLATDLACAVLAVIGLVLWRRDNAAA